MSIVAFPPNSRYHGLPIAELTLPSGETVPYVARRFIPQPDRFADRQAHTVLKTDRRDRLASRFLGDPELSWQLCDANVVSWPEELTATPGRRIRITLPQGIPSHG